MSNITFEQDSTQWLLACLERCNFNQVNLSANLIEFNSISTGCKNLNNCTEKCNIGVKNS